jgi:pimeloyl-ACP methyl ester carboxylesterase
MGSTRADLSAMLVIDIMGWVPDYSQLDLMRDRLAPMGCVWDPDAKRVNHEDAPGGEDPHRQRALPQRPNLPLVPDLARIHGVQVAVREGAFAGGLPYLAVGRGEPLVYLCGGTPNHRNPPPGLERRLTLRTVVPLARAGYEVFFTNRWPGMRADITWPEVADGHAAALREHFGRPVNVLGHSTGGSLVLQLIADHPQVVARAVVASAAYTLGPVAKTAQLRMLDSIETTGRFAAEEILDGMVKSRSIRAVLRALLRLASRRITIESPTDTVAMLRAEDGFDVRDRLPTIGTETLVICGAKDYFWSLDMFAETAYRMPHGRLVMYPDLGHGLVTSPRFVADVAAFLSGTP